jgi:hypothetical protein
VQTLVSFIHLHSPFLLPSSSSASSPFHHPEDYRRLLSPRLLLDTRSLLFRGLSPLLASLRQSTIPPLSQPLPPDHAHTTQSQKWPPDHQERRLSLPAADRTSTSSLATASTAKSFLPTFVAISAMMLSCVPACTRTLRTVRLPTGTTSPPTET